MVEVVGPRRLRFRRHLAACALVLLLNELRADLLGAGLGETLGTLERPARSSGGRWLRATRALLASAQEVAANSVYQYNTTDDLSLVGQMFSRFQDSLPVIDLNISLGPERRQFQFGQLDAEIDAYYNEQFPANMSLEGLQLASVKAALRTAPIPLHTSWGYETRALLRQGSLPVLNDELCAAQLAHLAHRLDAALQEDHSTASTTSAENSDARQVYKAGDLEIMRYLDTFGRVPADLLRGNVRWYGSRASCLRTRLRPLARSRPADEHAGRQQDQPAIKFRYCLAAYRPSGWPRAGAEPANNNSSRWIDYGVSSSDFNLGNLFLRVGVCLPEACDSAAIERPQSLRALERLLRFNLAKPFNSDHYKLTDLYCQPDSRSPLRRVPPAGRLLLVLVAIWLLLVLCATIVHLNVDKFYTKSAKLLMEQRRRKRADAFQGPKVADKLETDERDAAATMGGKNEFRESDICHLKRRWIELNVGVRERMRHAMVGVDLVECLSLYSNWLRYTRRVKLAIVREHQQATRAETRRKHNERLRAEIEAERRSPTFGNAQLSNGQLRAEPDHQLASATGSGPEEEEVEEPFEVCKRVDTSSLSALKVIALVWIIAGHCIFYLGSAISNGALLRDYIATLPAFALSNGALYITELFFVITGCLTAHLVFRHTTRRSVADLQLELSELPRAPVAAADCENESSERAEKKAEARGDQPPAACVLEPRLFGAPFWLFVALSRYLRIVPAYLLVYALVRLVSLYAGGEGQLWDYAVSANSMRRACQQESWVPVLTLTSNFVDLYRHCIVGGWYLSADMQFALAASPLLLLLARCQRVQVRLPAPVALRGGPTIGAEQFVARANKRLAGAYALVLGLALLSGVASLVAVVRGSPVDMSYLMRFAPHTVAILSQNIAMYTNPVFRFRAFALGLLLGHLLYLYEFRLIKLPALVQRHGAKLAAVIFAAGFLLMFAPVLYPPGKLRLSHDTTALLTIASATAIDLLLCALIFLVCVGKAPKLALFVLNSPFWSLAASLSLCAFLVHAEVIVLLTSALDPPPSVGYSLLLLVLSATLLATYALALGLHLAFELPVSRLLEASMFRLLASKPSARTAREKNAR